MRIAIVDDLADERALLREQLTRQLARRGAEAELLEFDSGEAFLAAEKERRFTAAFLDIYMEGMTGMEAARTLRKTDTDCLLVFTTTSTDHALEGFQVRALHYLVKPFAEAEIDALTDELLARVPQPERFMELRVEGGEIRLRYGEGKRRRLSLLQAEGRRRGPSICPPHRGTLRRGKHVYLSGRCVPRKGHAPRINAESGSSGGRGQLACKGEVPYVILWNGTCRRCPSKCVFEAYNRRETWNFGSFMR